MFEAELVQIIRSAIPDSGVNRPDAPLSPRALGFGKIGLHVTIPTTIQYRAIAAGSNRFQTQTIPILSRPLDVWGVVRTQTPKYHRPRASSVKQAALNL